MSRPETELLRPVLKPVAQDHVPLERETWWSRFRKSLGGYTTTSQTVLDVDSERTVAEVAPRKNGAVAIDVWPSSRVRTGIVVGSVQSGKTANMLAVAAKALDRGVGIVIVLAGTRIALWLQTYERVLRQLDGSTRENAYRADRYRVLVPAPNDVLGSAARADARQYLVAHRRRIADAVNGSRPVIIVVPKEDDHLSELAKLLHDALKVALPRRNQPLEMIVLDDEADDGSILTADDPDKVTPSLIRHLWSDSRSPEQSFDRNLLVTYVAYTATPQANFLQDTHNPLSPRHFHTALRVPADVGGIDAREPTFSEPEGLPKYYTGGRFFYERQPVTNCVILDFPMRSMGATEADHLAELNRFYWDTLGEALRAYMVAAAVRLSLSGRTYSAVRDLVGPLEELKRLSPDPQTMLIHPSARMDVHFEVAGDVLRWSAGADAKDPSQAQPGGGDFLDTSGLLRRIQNEEPKWQEWLARYQQTARALETLPGTEASGVVDLDWSGVREVLEREVLPGIRVRVLNSDDDASDRPRFEPVPSADKPQSYVAAPDLLSIFVAGNVLSRGLTLEGLTTSVFVRTTRTPAADAQMQMQRWFGYRGSYLSVCRVFLFRDQLHLFREYHANDESLKAEILRRASGQTRIGSDEPFLILQGSSYRATAKVDVAKIPLHPGATPAVEIVEHEDSTLVRGNVDVLAGLLMRNGWSDLSVAGIVRGRILSEPLGLVDVADLLDRFRYSCHAPDPSNPLYARWRSIEAAWALPRLLFLPPSPTGRLGTEPRGCPYSIAAYLRLWHQLLSRRDAKAFYPTDKPTTRWHLINLRAYQEARPRFYVGIRYGEAGVAHDQRLADNGIQTMIRRMTGSKLNVLWGSRGTGGVYRGDQLFDYHLHNTSPIPELHSDQIWRPRGHPGLVLFHIIHHPEKALDMVAVGLALPHGGPDHIAALR